MSDEGKLIVPSDLAKLEEVDGFAENWMNGMPFTKDQRDDIAISLSEVVTNAIEHGNAGIVDKMVTVVLLRIEGGIRIEVTDQGGGFNPALVADPTDPENLLSESGRGLLIVHHLMDEVDVEPVSTGTRISLVKRFTASNTG
ncbi:MAG TPA: ATP-binding protein [Bacteroidetes bacterium]|nr:serine-protein kinase RsbW [bacterium BMS3Bbin04]HDO66208.1 ATP-binding protein [Bacteroidota bacterium]HEX05333.1 ATP-binding protein [Bacteroidota bacterium]